MEDPLDEAASPRDGGAFRVDCGDFELLNFGSILIDTLGFPAIVAGVPSDARKGIAMSKFRDRMIRDMRLAGLVGGTWNGYHRAVRQLAAFYMISPDRLSERDVGKYILYIRDESGVAKGTFAPTFLGLKFFYLRTLGYGWPLFTKKEFASQPESGCPTSAVTRIAATGSPHSK